LSKVTITAIDWVEDPDYPTIYKVSVLRNNFILNIATTAKPLLNCKIGDEIFMTESFYPLFDVKNNQDFTSIEVLRFPK
jgi:hypothetical protein